MEGTDVVTNNEEVTESQTDTGEATGAGINIKERYRGRD